MSGKPKKYTLRAIQPSEVQTRGKWKQIALDLIEQFDVLPERNVEVLNGGKPIKSKRELVAFYDAFKAVIKRNKLTIDVKTKEGKLFLLKDLRYFVKQWLLPKGYGSNLQITLFPVWNELSNPFSKI